jgi:hypothetical protein
MDLESLYEERLNISEQRYSNTSRAYWHGSYKRDLDFLMAYPHGDDEIPLAWVSNSIVYAETFAIPREDGALYRLRQLKVLNIWNPLADKDWSALITMFPEYNVGNTRNALATYDWLSLFVRAGKLRVFRRGDLLEAVQSLRGYDGVFNRESWSGSPSVGIFPKSTRLFGVVNRYEWDGGKDLWRCVGQPNRVYNPKMKKLMTLKEDNTIFYEGGRQ